jgi:hypothetical protein
VGFPPDEHEMAVEVLQGSLADHGVPQEGKISPTRQRRTRS